ncbi:MAG TPA: hypothetical protein PK098_02695 [Phycisphaerales bacterium]|nr:hypothetical protein [Phycisphaerales bacterium]
MSHGCGPTSAIVDMGAFETAGVVPAAPLIFADLNGDGVVDVMDLLILMNQWGECKSRCCIADLNLDGYVDVLDLLGLLAHWG